MLVKLLVQLLVKILTAMTERQAALFVAGCMAALAALRIVTWHPLAHGPRLLLLQGILIAASMTLFAAGCTALATKRGYWSVVIVLMAFGWGDLMHYARLVQVSGDVVRRGPESQLERPVSAGLLATWLQASPGATVKHDGDAIEARLAPGETAFLELPAQPSRNGLLPAGFTPHALQFRIPTLVIEWSATATLQGDFLFLFDAGNWHVQARPWGLTITTQDRNTGVFTAEHHQLTGQPGQLHRWRVELGPHEATLFRDSVALWYGTNLPIREFIRVGETRSDELHGGTLRIEQLRVWWEWTTRDLQ